MFDFPSPPPGVQLAIKNEGTADDNTKRKRSSGEVPSFSGNLQQQGEVGRGDVEEVGDNMLPPPPRHTSVEAWASKVSKYFYFLLFL